MNGERLRQVRKVLKLSQHELGEKLGINASAISQMESNRIRPSLDTMFLLNKYYGVNLHWLITGVGEMFTDSRYQHLDPEKSKLNQLQVMLNDQLNAIIKAKKNIDEGDILDIPVTGEIAAGPPVETNGDVLEVVSIRRSMIHGIEDDFICLRVNGQSMEPDIMSGDVILIRPSLDWNSLSGKICAVRVDGSITLKKMMLDYNKKLIFLVSLNEDYQPIIIDPDNHQDIKLVGYLFFLFRKLQ